ncbi:hypothetical protein AGABI1DRAFT_105107 [Agaricus bisporus var. burnettii JB137-S8]|nr:uncharacterized protein AGABI1DRAFT_105107 [Agaricus bisporus var. burnettii JB137-S8]EKM81556.1 hypothetical protein AGABI1DRAFT_105107 [Agaricus bisporus var. burnettii JB137-S8]
MGIRERLLSIQSHVVFGYVGGRAAVFPLECLGYDVDVVNTVNYSNHAGYGNVGGTKTSAKELENIFKILEENELLAPTRLLTGYIPDAESLSAVNRIVQKLKEERPGLIYLLDPVMGDAGKLYVAADVVPVYKQMLPLATIIAPNWYEVELLTDTPMTDMPSLQKALLILHKKYQVPNVVISSIPLKPWLLAGLPSSISPPNDVDDHEDRADWLFCLSSSIVTISGDATPSHTHINGSKSIGCPSIVHAARVPLIPGYFSGVGDLFSAFLLSHFQPTVPIPLNSTSAVQTPQPPSEPTHVQTPFSYAASLALTKTHAILSKTHEYSLSLPEEERLPSDDELDIKNPMRKVRRMRGRELALIQNQDIIRGVGLSTANTRWMGKWESFWEN